MTSQPGQQTITIHILPNISRSKSNQTMKIGQVIKHNNRNIFYQKSYRKRDRETSSRPIFVFLFFKKILYQVKASGLQFGFSILRQSSTWYTMKTSCIKLQAADPEICSVLIFQKRDLEQFLHHILRMIFQEKCFSCYLLLADQILLRNCLYFLTYCVFQLFVRL